MAFNDSTLLADLYDGGPGSLVPLAGSQPMTFRFNLYAPCQVTGVRMINAITGSPTLRIGMFLNGVEQVAQRTDVPNVPVGPINMYFATPYVAAWSDLRFQTHGNTDNKFAVVVWDTAASMSGFYQGYSDASHHPLIGSNIGQLGVALSIYGGFLTSIGVTTWGYAVTSVAGYAGFSPIVVADDYTYEPTVWADMVGGGPLTQNVLTDASTSRTTSSRFAILQAGSTIWGARFYNHDPAAWTAKASLWNPSGTLVATGTVATSGIGVYNCMFSSEHVTTASEVGNQRFTYWTVGINNQTNLNYTAVTKGTLPWSQYYRPSWRAHQTNYASQLNEYYAATDALPTLTDSSYYYPVSPLVTEL